MHQEKQSPRPLPRPINQQSILTALQNLDTMEQRMLAMIDRMRTDLTTLYDQLHQP